MRRLTAAEKEEIHADYKTGIKVKEIAEKFSVSEQTVYRVLNPKKLPTLRELNEDKRIKLSEADIAEINRLCKEGYTLRSLAIKFGVSSFCIRYHLSPEFAKQNNQRVAVLHAADEKYQKKNKERIAQANLRRAYRKYLSQVPAQKLEFAMKAYLSLYSEERLKTTLKKIYKKVTKEKKENV